MGQHTVGQGAEFLGARHMMLGMWHGWQKTALAEPSRLDPCLSWGLTCPPRGARCQMGVLMGQQA